MNRAHKFILIARTIVALCAIAVWPLCSSRAQTPLPDDISIAPPAPTVARDAAAFSGAWLGAWSGELPTALIVEQISSNGQAQVIYSVGDLPFYHVKASWFRQAGQISNGKLHLQLKSGAKIDFTLEPGGLLQGRIEWNNQPPAFAELHRMPTMDVSSILEAAKKPVFDWEEIRIPVHSQIAPTKGKTFDLQTTIFPQTSPGRHPVVIWNHGSTGPGMIPTNLIFRGDSATMFFRSLGYVVVVPMRKGRGASGGPDIEEDNTLNPSIQLDSAIEDLQAVVAYVRQRNDIDPDKIIVAGVSRGGFLSVAYAGRYPTNVAGVINFSGGWFGMRDADFNFETFGKSGQDAKVPMLWLYADHDSYYSLKFDESEFSKFRDAGGHGELVEVRDIPGDGHMLCLWVDHWRDKVTNYLNGLWTASQAVQISF
jgi:dienelactone hydrolase